jgi:hypothetical protein
MLLTHVDGAGMLLAGCVLAVFLIHLRWILFQKTFFPSESLATNCAVSNLIAF